MSETYSVALRVTAIDDTTAVFGSISRSLGGLERGAASASARIAGIGRLLSGLAVGSIGIGLAGMFKGPIDSAIKYENALNRFRQLNLGGLIDRDADALAKHAGVFGANATQMMNTVRDLTSVFGSFHEAQRLAPKIAALNAANAGIFGEGHGIDEKASLDLMRVIDRRGGAKDATTFTHTVDLVQKMMNATGGVVDMRALAQFSQYGGTAFRALSDEGLLDMTGLLVEQGGMRAGTALMSAFQNLEAGRGSLKAKAIMAELGLGTLAEKVIGHVGSKPIKSRELMHIKGADELRASPVGWVRDVLLPQLKARHLITGRVEDGERDTGVILKTINDIASNRLASTQLGIIATQLPQLLRDAAIARNAKGADAMVADYRASTQGQWDALRASLADLGIVVGQ
ncbi:MAG: hypothetical protein JO002_03220 [Burkholderiaceae bacterium]|nr:hypothetical protein [Burkholderiaceae bacterium]